MPEEATNTEKIQTLVARIPSLSEAWSNAIEDQNDDTISEAWIATVEHFFPDTEDLNPESVLELIKSKELPFKNPSDFYHPIKLIADILVGLTDDFCFGEMERLLDYCGLEPEGVVNPGSYYIDITKTLDGFSYELSEEDTEVESWFSNKKLSETDLVKIVQNYEQNSIKEFYNSWVLVFSIEEKGNPKKNVYSLFASEDEMFYYVEEAGQPDGKYKTSPKKAFYSSSLKINKSSLWEITEGQWDKEMILQHFEWQDLNIEWLARDEDEDEDEDDEDEDEDDVVVYDPLNLSEEEEKERASFIAEVEKQCKDRAKELGLPGVEEQELAEGINLEMVLIPAGKFMMGSPASEKGRTDDEAQHEVTLTKPYYMGKYEVTQEQWEALMGDNPSETKGAKLPVTDVSWKDCQKFIKKLNASTNGNYRLPRDAEWEYACRAGTSTAYSFGDEITPKDANYDDSGIDKPVEVGSYKPNAFGLYDMHGNVCEWCEDWKADYPAGAVTDPKGPATGKRRVLRGGSFDLYGPDARSSSRDGGEPTLRYDISGFRLARTK